MSFYLFSPLLNVLLVDLIDSLSNFRGVLHSDSSSSPNDSLLCVFVRKETKTNKTKFIVIIIRRVNGNMIVVVNRRCSFFFLFIYPSAMK